MQLNLLKLILRGLQQQHQRQEQPWEHKQVEQPQHLQVEHLLRFPKLQLLNLLSIIETGFTDCVGVMWDILPLRHQALDAIVVNDKSIDLDSGE